MLVPNSHAYTTYKLKLTPLTSSSLEIVWFFLIPLKATVDHFCRPSRCNLKQCVISSSHNIWPEALRQSASPAGSQPKPKPACASHSGELWYPIDHKHFMHQIRITVLVMGFCAFFRMACLSSGCMGFALAFRINIISSNMAWHCSKMWISSH